MENRIIRCRINVSKIDKAKLYKGKNGFLLNFTMIEKKTEYSDWMIIEDITKEETDAGKKGTILGNGKNVERRADVHQVTSNEPTEDLPF
jgi:hypothetical protein